MQQLKAQYGSCEHRSLGFQAMGAWLGIPTRIVAAEKYFFVEASVDGGYSWERYDLGNESHPELKVTQSVMPFAQTQRGVTISPQVRRMIVALGPDARRWLVHILCLTDQELESWICLGDSTPLPLGEHSFRSYFWYETKSWPEMVRQLTNKLLLKVPICDQTAAGELLDLAIGLCASLDLVALDSADLISTVTEAVLTQSQTGQYSTGALCQALTELAEKAKSKLDQYVLGFILNRVLQAINQITKPERSSLGDGVLQLVACIVLNNSWPQTNDNLVWLHVLANSATYGERARLKLDSWYNSMQRKLDCSLAASGERLYEQAALKLTDNGMIAELTGQGRSHSLESRLRVRGGIKHVYSWAISNQLSCSRLIRRQPFFQQGTESITLPPIVMVIPFTREQLTRDNPELEQFYLPLASGQGQIAWERSGRSYQFLEPYEQYRKLKDTIDPKWSAVFNRKLFTGIFRRQLSDDLLRDHAKYQRQTPGMQRAIDEAIKQFHREYVTPLWEFRDNHVPLLEVLAISFYQYLYQTTGMKRGNVKILYPLSCGGKESMDGNGFFQPCTENQWSDVFTKCCYGARRNGMNIHPNLLQRNGRFKQAEVITGQELLICWKEYLDSLGDLEDLKKLCVTWSNASPGAFYAHFS